MNGDIWEKKKDDEMRKSVLVNLSGRKTKVVDIDIGAREKNGAG